MGRLAFRIAGTAYKAEGIARFYLPAVCSNDTVQVSIVIRITKYTVALPDLLTTQAGVSCPGYISIGCGHNRCSAFCEYIYTFMASGATVAVGTPKTLGIFITLPGHRKTK